MFSNLGRVLPVDAKLDFSRTASVNFGSRLAQDRQVLPCVACSARHYNLCGALMASRHEAAWGEVALSFGTGRARQNLYRRGEPTEDMLVICEGWAFRFRQLADGRRQILSVLLPGDFVTASAPFQESFDFSVQALTDVRYCRIRRADVRARLAVRDDLLTDVADFLIAERREADEQLLDLGKRMADERIAGLIWRLMERFSLRGQVKEQSFPFPLRQKHIADITGLTPVHVSRVIGLFRKRGLLMISGGIITILDLPELRRLGALN
jgi:CRP/FNR family transcriptional regulator, anaerobic regulatory protein